MFEVKILNTISPKGLKRLTGHGYIIGEDILDPDAIFRRSYKLHGIALPDSVQTVARCGAGVDKVSR